MKYKLQIKVLLGLLLAGIFGFSPSIAPVQAQEDNSPPPVDAIVISVNSQQLKVGDKISVTFALKPGVIGEASEKEFTNPNSNHFINLFINGNQPAAKGGSFKGGSFPTFEFTIDPNQYKFIVGQNALHATVSSAYAGLGVGFTTQLYGDASVAIANGSVNGVSIEEARRYKDGQSVVVEYKVVSGQPGTISLSNLDCGGGAGKDLEEGKFQCTYPVEKKDYQVSAKVTVGSSQYDTGIKTSITGDENAGINSPGQTGGADFTDMIAAAITYLIGLFNEFIFFVFWLILTPIIQALLSIHVYTDAFANVIYPGWEIFRNLANIFFIVSLIFIALATLFRLESYNYKHLLVNVILAALLVNFSLVIGQSILGVADTMQSQFLPNNKDVINALGQRLMVDQYRDTKNIPLDVRAQYGATSSIIKGMVGLSLAVGAFVAFGALAIFLVIRVVMLWVLLMLSPVPYFAQVLPFTKSFTREWWSHFIKYAFFTPIMAFFLNMTAIIVTNYNTVISNVLTNPTQNAAAGSQSPNFTSFVLNTSSTILMLVFLVIGMKVAEQFGIVGASALTKAVQGGIALPFVAAGAGATYLGRDVAGRYIQRKYNEKTNDWGQKDAGVLKNAAFAFMHPISTAKSFRKDAQELLDESKHATDAATLGIKRQTPGFRRRGEDPRVLYNEHRGKELYDEQFGGESGSEQEIGNNFMVVQERAANGDKEAQLILAEMLRIMQKNNNSNYATELYSTDKRGLGLDQALAYNKENYQAMIQDLVHKGAMTHDVAEVLLTRSNPNAYDVKDLTFAENTYTDSDGKTHMFKMKYNDGKKTFEAVGTDIYEDLHNRAANDPTSIDDATYLRNLEALEKTLSADKLKEYTNAKLFQSKKREARINFSKSKSELDLLQPFHDNFITKSGDKWVLGAAGEYTFTNTTGTMEWAASRGAIKGMNREKLEHYIKQSSSDIRENLRETLIKNARAAGERLTDAEADRKAQIAEYKTMRLAFAGIKNNDVARLKLTGGGAGGTYAPGAGHGFNLDLTTATDAQIDSMITGMRTEIEKELNH